jgi:hypothetical protein
MKKMMEPDKDSKMDEKFGGFGGKKMRKKERKSSRRK